jgi:hypothetical protein
VPRCRWSSIPLRLGDVLIGPIYCSPRSICGLQGIVRRGWISPIDGGHRRGPVLIDRARRIR